MTTERNGGVPRRGERLASARRIVVKIGSGVIATRGRLRPRVIADLAHDVTVLHHQGYEVILVVSGAVAAGFGALSMAKPPKAVVERQAAACVGQHRLMAMLAAAFKKHRIDVAQLLLMAEDIEHRRRFISARHTLQMLLNHRIVPILNENDPLADDEAKVGDNDHLAALVTNLVSADLLVILSSVAGVYRNGSSEVIPCVPAGSSIDEHITQAVTETGVGGMFAKVSAAHLAGRGGLPTVIADGTKAGVLQRIVRGDEIGTIFLPQSHRLNSRKRWIALRSRSSGVVRVDSGAHRAITDRGASLLPSGILAVDGRFHMGARVDVTDDSGATFAVGLVSYASGEIERMKGKRRADFEPVLGYKYVDEIIHRDDMVVLTRSGSG